MKARGISLVLILLAGSLVSPIEFSYGQVANVPNAPTSLVSFAVSSSQIDLFWAAPTNSTLDQVNGYKVEIKPGCTGSFSILMANTTTTATTFSSTGLVSGICYEYRVSAMNSVGVGSTSNTASTTTWSVPSQPTSLTASAISHSQINLSWTAPNTSGGTPVNGYKIERRDSCAGNFSVLITNTNNTNTAYSNTGLVNGTCYQYRIFAHNAVGTSLASNNATATTPQAPVPIHVPNVPTGLSVVASSSNSSLKLTWNAPSDNGGAPIIGYKIQRNGTTLVNNTGTVQTNYTNTGLLSNHQQTYRVAAWNSAGLGPYSNNMTGKTANQTGTIPTDVGNLGQLVSEFVHRQNALFKQQREETINAIKDCNDKVRNAASETRKQVKENCKQALKEIREKYQDARKQFQVEFKEFRENAKLLLKEAKKSKIIDKRDVKEFNHDIKDIAKETKKQDKELKKEVKQIKKELKKDIKEIKKESKKSKDKSDKDDDEDDDD